MSLRCPLCAADLPEAPQPGDRVRWHGHVDQERWFYGVVQAWVTAPRGWQLARVALDGGGTVSINPGRLEVLNRA